MIKKTVKFEDAYGRHVEEDIYFNLTESELMTLQISAEGGWSTHIENIAKAENGAKAFQAMSDLILLAYGVRREDGRGFDKSDQLREQFKNSFAHNELIISFLQDPDSASDFARALVPEKMIARLRKTMGEEVHQEVPAPSRPAPQDHLKPAAVVLAETDPDAEAFARWKAQQTANEGGSTSV